MVIAGLATIVGIVVLALGAVVALVIEAVSDWRHERAWRRLDANKTPAPDEAA